MKLIRDIGPKRPIKVPVTGESKVVAIKTRTIFKDEAQHLTDEVLQELSRL